MDSIMTLYTEHQTAVLGIAAVAGLFLFHRLFLSGAKALKRSGKMLMLSALPILAGGFYALDSGAIEKSPTAIAVVATLAFLALSEGLTLFRLPLSYSRPERVNHDNETAQTWHFWHRRIGLIALPVAALAPVLLVNGEKITELLGAGELSTTLLQIIGGLALFLGSACYIANGIARHVSESPYSTMEYYERALRGEFLKRS